ncbi:MAG: VOC family protein [Ginsengibacter sp.]
MAINHRNAGIHHIGLRCNDMAITKKFYQDVLGFTLVFDTPAIIAFVAGPAIIAFQKAKAEFQKDVFMPFNIGPDHVALTCETEGELHRVAKELSEAGVDNTGVKLDETLQKLYVAFKDPNRFNGNFIWLNYV